MKKRLLLIRITAKIFTICYFFLLSSSIQAQQIGVNYNGLLADVNGDQLQRTNTKWVRGFVDFFEFYNNPARLNTDPRIQGYLSLKGMGYKTILNIKWDFAGKSFPEPNSQEMTNYKNFLVTLLDKVWNKTDIIVVGNEPFIESIPNERGTKIINFYKEVAIKVKTYRDNHTNIPIYMGSFDNLYLVDKQQSDGVLGLLAFANNTSWIAGVDLHIHHFAVEDITTVMNFVSPKIRSTQKIIITEYSLMKYWRNQMDGTIPAGFANRHNRNAGWKNWQYLNYALNNPVSRPEWVDYLSSSPWFESRKHYLLNSYDVFKRYGKFLVATYAIRQSFGNAAFTSSTDPWILNGLYVNRTVVPNPSDGKPQFNYSFIDDFRAIQTGAARIGENLVEETPVSAFSIWPNPATQQVTISHASAQERITIRNSQGQLVKVVIGNRFSVADLPQGFYIIQLPSHAVSLKLVKD